MIRRVNSGFTYFSGFCKDLRIACTDHLSTAPGILLVLNSQDWVRKEGSTSHSHQVFLCSHVPLLLSNLGFHSGLPMEISLTSTPHSVHSYFPTDSRTEKA